jgi:Protein of unknown function (DUF1759)
MASRKITTETIKADRNVVATKLEFFRDQIHDHDSNPLHPQAVVAYMKETDLWRQNLDEGFRYISEINPSDLEDHKKDYLVLLLAVWQIQHQFWDIKATFPNPTQVTATTSLVNTKLPKLEIQPFHGDYIAWSTFKDSFEAAIHNNARLTKVEKFTYLKLLLKGEAARYTQSLAFTEANYDQAWLQLHDRYQNKRKITMAALELFFGHLKAADTGKFMKGLIDATHGCIRSL